MTSDELKAKYSMQYIVEQYGYYPDRAGFIHCPFHKGDKGASMKIYKDSYYCFGCGATGDIFTFIQQMDHCDFKTAFQSLGGAYAEPSFKSKLEQYRRSKKLEERQSKEIKDKSKIDTNIMLITIYRDWLSKLAPLSQAWCDCYNALQSELYHHEILNEER